MKSQQNTSVVSEPAGKSGNGAHHQFCLAVLPKADWQTQLDGDCTLSFPLYWLTAESSISEKTKSAIQDVLSDQLQENILLTAQSDRLDWLKQWSKQDFTFFAEKQFNPGVTDNLAHTVMEALLLKGVSAIQVASGTGFLFASKSPLKSIESIEKHARYRYFHPVTERFAVHSLKDGNADQLNQLNQLDQLLTFPAVTLPEPLPVEPVSLQRSDEELVKLSQDRLLALNLVEMKAIQKYFARTDVRAARKDGDLPFDPTDVEIEILAQTWSEHCKHKIFNADISFLDLNADEGPRTEIVQSLYKTYVQGATKKLKHRRDLLSVFKDNAGVLQWNDEWAVCFKVETHNSPSALEPYGGALTGILGVNRDVLGTGLGARPIFNTDVFCFAYPSEDLAQRPKLLPPEAILNGVRKGVEDGGNKSGIPTINGSILFDKGYRAKPLVFCGTGGLLPLMVKGKKGYEKHTAVGDVVVMAGGRVGKDGIHGATFSSEALHAGSPVSAVQIGDPFTQKRLIDFVIEARDAGLITGITDNGAGGLSSSVGEMASITGGASIDLNLVPTKYPGLADWEVTVSESQERMTISARSEDKDKLIELARKFNVEASVIGTFNDSGLFEVRRGDQIVASLELEFLHGGCPVLQLEAIWRSQQITMTCGSMPDDLAKVLLDLLAHPNICSREGVIRRYDHEVQGMSVVKQLMGPKQIAPCDAAVIAPLYDSHDDSKGGLEGLVVSNGLAPRLSKHDCYLMAQCAVDEAIRNAVCVGVDPNTIALLDNFCWPDPVHSVQNKFGKEKLGHLVRACRGLHDAVLAHDAPLISGKDSMKNEFNDGAIQLSIPPTLLISAVGKAPDVTNCVTMNFKKAGDLIYLLSAGGAGLAGSQYEELMIWQSALVPTCDPSAAAQLYRKLHSAIVKGWVSSAHDVSDGGVAVSLAECVIGAKGLGAKINGDKLEAMVDIVATSGSMFIFQDILLRTDSLLFGEGPGMILVSIDPAHKSEWEKFWVTQLAIFLGEVNASGELEIDRQGAPVIKLPVDQLERAWRKELPFE